MKHIILSILMLVTLVSCLKEENSKKPFITFIPKEMNDGWDISTPLLESIDSNQLSYVYKEFQERKDTWQVRSLLVFRNGKLVAESYAKDDNDIITPRLVQSCTKQVVGILTGIAIEKGVLDNVSDPISKYIPEVNNHDDKKGITLQHLLTMRSGIDFKNEGMRGNNFDLLQQKPGSLCGYLLGLPMANSPGQIARYKDCDAHLVAICIQNRVKKKTSEWAREVLFDPLGIHYLNWENYRDGYTFGGYGIFTTPRELGKFGQLVLDSGEYKGNRIVSKQWIKEMTTIREQNVYGTQFGYLWRLNSGYKWVMMMGHGGQFVCIVPEKKLIVVITAEPLIQGDYQLDFSINYEYVRRISAMCK